MVATWLLMVFSVNSQFQSTAKGLVLAFIENEITVLVLLAL